MAFWKSFAKTFSNPLELAANVSTFGQYGAAKSAFGKGGPLDPGAPPAPDYAGAAQAQADSSRAAIDAQTAANRPNSTNAFGSTQQWTTGPDGKPQLVQSFGGQLGDAAQGLQSQVADAFGKPVMTGDAARDQAIQAAYGQATSRLDPRFKADEESLRTRLVNQGLDPQSQAYVHALREFDQTKNDAYSSAMNGAIGQGTAAGDSAFRNNAMARQMPLQDLLQMQGLLQQPGFNAAGAADPTQHMASTAMAGNYAMQDKQMKNQFWADLFGGAANVGAKAFGAG